MKPPIGFVLLTHEKPRQIIGLINILNRMFDFPPIACHHDFYKCDLPVNSFGSNVRFVSPCIHTSYGDFSLVEAMMHALRLLYERPDSPDWFVLLSGVDYPIKPANKILQDLASSPFNVHIHHEQIVYKSFERDWQRKCFARYCTVNFQFPIPNLHRRKKIAAVKLRHPLLTSPFLPFSKNLSCFAGEQWFCADRKAAQYLIKFYKEKPALAYHYRKVKVPDESYYQTVFCNAPHLKVSDDNLRYIDWSEGGASPKTLGIKDLPSIHASPAHFARKFNYDTDTEIISEINKMIFI